MTKERFDQLAELGSRIAAEQDRQEMGKEYAKKGYCIMETMDEAIKKLSEFALAKAWDKQTQTDVLAFMKFARLIGKHEGLTQMHAGIQSVITDELGLAQFESDVAKRSGALGVLGDL